MTKSRSVSARARPTKVKPEPYLNGMGKKGIPVWNRCRCELSFNGKLVKKFRVPAPSQRLILEALEEVGWPPQLDDPLPRQANRSTKSRLHNAIESLNKNQVNRLIRFRGDGTGRGITWEPIADRSPIDRR